ncbi:TrmH family RNA methyltransferase [Thermoflavimicrobium dichotomicum]|nr:RNA methyltransferase [Thermoflavimicrobium dichotomicum]
MNKKVIQITSSHNEQMKRWKKLHSRKGRMKYQALLVEGEHLVSEAIRAQVPIRSLIVDEKQEEKVKQLNTSAPIYMLSSSLFHSLMETESPQGIAAEIHMKEWKEEELLAHAPSRSIFLLLDAIQDPGNLGTILRTAEAAGVTGVFIGKGTVDPYNPKVVRAAMGSIFRLPLVQVDLSLCLPRLKERGIHIIGTSPHAGKWHFEYTFPSKVAILLGNEGRGVDPALFSFVDEQVMIPMPGGTESLNVAITSAILLYERIRQQYLRG